MPHNSISIRPISRALASLLPALLLFLHCASAPKPKPASKASSENKLLLDPMPVFENPEAVFRKQDEDIQTRKMAASQMMEENKATTPSILLELCKKEPILLSAEILSYFGEENYVESIPFIQSSLESKPSPAIIYHGVFALLHMREEAANSFVLAYCPKRSGEHLYQCLLAVYDTENKAFKMKAYSIFAAIFKKKPPPQEKTRLLAKTYLEQYSKKKKKQKKKKKAVKKTAKRPSPRSYRKYLSYQLRKQLGPVQRSTLLRELDQGIKLHIKLESSKGHFTRNAYETFYKKKYDAKKMQSLIARGLSLPWSLHAFIAAVRSEYEGLALQSYSLAQLLSISQKHARILLQTIKR